MHIQLLELINEFNQVAGYKSNKKDTRSIQKEVPYDQAIPLLEIYLKERKIYIHTEMYINAHCGITSKSN